MREIIYRIAKLKRQKNLTESEREELKELQAINQMQLEEDEEEARTAEDYGMCLSQWGWM